MKIRITSKVLEAAKRNPYLRAGAVVFPKDIAFEGDRQRAYAACEALIAEHNKIDAPIEDALKSVNGRATAHTVTSAGGVRSVAIRVEEELLARGSKKKNLPGTVATYCPEAPGTSYKYDCKSTKIELTRTSGGWFLTDVETVYLWPGKKEAFEYLVPPALHDDILRVATANITVAP